MNCLFLSHSIQDAPVAQRLAAGLTESGMDVWMDNGRLSISNPFPKCIDDAFKRCSAFMLLWSRAARQSNWVKREWTSALIFNKKIVICALDDTPLPAELGDYLCFDFRKVFRNFSILLAALKRGAALPATGAKPSPAKALPETRRTRPQLAKPKQEIEPVHLRQNPLTRLSTTAVERMLEMRDFFDSAWRKDGKGIRHDYEEVELFGGELVIDHATDLTWQKNGSANLLKFSEVPGYIDDLNRREFGGHRDWRLPTLEEAMSLVEPQRLTGDLHISPVWGTGQRYIWSADRRDEDVIWFVHFPNGGLGNCRTSAFNYVRAVRCNRPVQKESRPASAFGFFRARSGRLFRAHA